MAIGVVVSRYHGAITSALRDGAVAAFTEAGGDADQLIIIDAPGSWELPVLCLALAERPELDGVVALGCVIEGETTHDQHINRAVAEGLMQISLAAGIPVGFGLLTCHTMEQAEARAGGSRGNKGIEAMRSVIEAIVAMQSMEPVEEDLS